MDAGKKLTAEESESQFQLAHLAMKRMDFFATLLAKLDTMESVQFVGKVAQVDSETMELSVLSPRLMEEALEVSLVGPTKKSGVFCTIQSAEKVSTLLDAASALPTA